MVSTNVELFDSEKNWTTAVLRHQFTTTTSTI